jgi:hypothetical protein
MKTATKALQPGVKQMKTIRPVAPNGRIVIKSTIAVTVLRLVSAPKAFLLPGLLARSRSLLTAGPQTSGFSIAQRCNGGILFSHRQQLENT